MSRINARHQSINVGIKSYWPIGVKRLFLTLNEIPWVSLTALSSLTGGILLFTYLRSIGPLPSDISALFGLVVTTSIVSIALLFVFAFVLFSPTWIYQHGLADLDPSFKTLDRWRMSLDLAGLQFGAIGVISLCVAFKEFTCSRSVFWWLLIGGALCIWGIYSIFRVILTPKDRKKRLGSFGCALMIGFCGVTPFVILLPLQLAIAPTGTYASLILLGLWVLVIGVNAFLAPSLGGLSAGVFALAVAAYLYLVLPLFGSNPILFPTFVAQILGIREAESHELRVPQKTCQLLLSAVTEKPLQGVFCPAGEWGQVNAKILSNVGDRWLIEIPIDNTPDNLESPSLRVSIPKDGVQVIERTAKSLKTVSGDGCRKAASQSY